MAQPERISLEWDERGGVTVHVDGQPQSHVQPDDPGLLAFEYVQHLALAVDACGAPARMARSDGGSYRLAEASHARFAVARLDLLPAST